MSHTKILASEKNCHEFRCHRDIRRYEKRPQRNETEKETNLNKNEYCNYIVVVCSKQLFGNRVPCVEYFKKREILKKERNDEDRTKKKQNRHTQ